MSGRNLRHWSVCAAIAMLAASAVSGAAQRGLQKSIFVGVLDENGKPLTDLAINEFAIREDNADRQIVAVKPPSQPISVAVLIDTAQGKRVTDAYGTAEEYTRDLRVAASAFAKRLLTQSPNAEVSLMEFGQAAIVMVPFTPNPMEFEKGVNRLVVRPDVGSVLFEALAQANSDLGKRPSSRRAIVSLNLEPSDEQSREEPNKVKAGFGISLAQLWAVSVQRGGLKNSKRDLVLNDFAKYSGGKRDFVVGISAVENIMKGYADALAAQYEIVYERPENAKNIKVVQVGTTRGKIHASGFAPQ